MLKLLNNKASSVVSKFFLNTFKVRDKLLKIINMVFEKGEVPSDLRKISIKPLCKMVKRVSTLAIVFTLACLGIKLLNLLMLIRLVLDFTAYELAFHSGDKRATRKVMSLHNIPDKYIKVISAISRTLLLRLN